MIRHLIAIASGKVKIMAATSGTQTVMVYPKSLGGYVIDLLEKLNEIKGIFGSIKEELNRGQQHIDQSQNNVESMEVAINSVSTSMDMLGNKMLENNVAEAQRNLQIQKVKQEIVAKKEELQRLLEQTENQNIYQQEQTIVVLKKERKLLEQQLRRINHDIETVYEEMFETQEKLAALQDQRISREESEQLALVALRDQSVSSRRRQEQLLSIDVPDQQLNMQELYVSQAELRRVQAEIEEMKHKQFLTEQHIKAQLEEREFLRQTAEEIVQKVYNLEKIVRKEKGDQNPESPNTVQPVWRQDLSGPKIWYQAPTFSVEQLKRLMAEEYQKHPTSRNWTEEPGTSGFGDVEEKIETNIYLES